LFGGDLPRPRADRCTIYVLGAGVGESVIMTLPNGAALVMDSCSAAGATLPVLLLEHLGITRIALLVVSHPDLDHVRGVAELVRRFEPRDVWTYPLSASFRDAFVDFCQASGKPKYLDLASALRALDEHQHRTGRVADATYGARELVFGDVTARSLAPSHFDQSRMRRVWVSALRAKGGPAKYFEGILAGRFRLGDAPNVLSVAIGVRWRGHRVLLAGDVMCGTSSPLSGWKGIMRLLREDGQLEWVTDIGVVKVAHHGSRHSFDAGVWSRHAASVRPTAVLAPFEPSGLPDGQTLQGLRARSNELLVSASSQGVRQRAAAAGWTVSTVNVLAATTAPCAVIELMQNGQSALHVSSNAVAFA